LEEAQNISSKFVHGLQMYFLSKMENYNERLLVQSIHHWYTWTWVRILFYTLYIGDGSCSYWIKSDSIDKKS